MKAGSLLVVCAFAAGVPLTAQAQTLPPKVLAAMQVCESSTAPSAPALGRLAALAGKPGGLPAEATAPNQTMQGLIALAKLKAKASTDTAATIPVFMATVCLHDQGITNPPPQAIIAQYLRTH